MRILTSSCIVSVLAAMGCYSSADHIGGDGSGTPDVAPEVSPDTITPDVPPDLVPPDVVPPDVPPDPWIDPDPDASPDVWPDVPPDVADAEAPPGGIVGDGCSGWYDCTGMPSSSADCWFDIMGFARFPGGYCSASCGSDWECGLEGECVDVVFITMCLRTCDYEEDCRTSEGYSCMELPFVGGGPYCLPTG
ncbi:MAG: hypothetical protein JRG91_02655 [Deltaproteobacteria bacterium]|nr:hypothetical protein [Deltaproteobacteria bacterium]